MISSFPTPLTALSANVLHSCAVRLGGVVECWGSDVNGQVPAVRRVEWDAGRSSFVEVAASSFYTCGMNDFGFVECWGGLGTTYTPPATLSRGYSQIGGRDYRTCALRLNGVAECWGVSLVGIESKAAATGTFTQVDAGRDYACAVRSDGVVECWGSGGTYSAPRTQSASIGRFIQVSAGMEHTCALRDDGAVECWGSNAGGAAPAMKNAMSGGFTQVSAGWAHTCALRNDSVVECWGAVLNGVDFGQAPSIKAAATGTFVRVEAGAFHTCALRSDGAVECWGYHDAGQAPATKVSSAIQTVNLPPEATLSAPASVVAGHAFAVALNNAHVTGYSGFVTFTYAFDCGDGVGLGAFGASNSTTRLTSAIGTRNVTGFVRDQDGDQTGYAASVAVIYSFGGFTGPVDAPPTVNLAKAGSAIPVKFTLGGNQGMAILAAGYPVSQNIVCNAASSTDPIEQTVMAGASSLSYDSSTGLYRYTWKTDKSWSGTCRRLTIRLADGGSTSRSSNSNNERRAEQL